MSDQGGFIKIFLFSLTVFLLSCATTKSTSYVEVAVDRPLSQVVKIVKATLPLDVESVSRTGRIYETGYFSREGGKLYEFQATDKVRRKIVVFIDKLKRPYVVRIQVPIEERSERTGRFQVVDSDEVFLRVLKKKLQQTASQVKKHRDFIQDFRAY